MYLDANNFYCLARSQSLPASDIQLKPHVSVPHQVNISEFISEYTLQLVWLTPPIVYAYGENLLQTRMMICHNATYDSFAEVSNI